uniref:RRM domain-containing protein n=1 Tax=Biomphalaria glabrata TaxID=6526 RepID=A0A2C9LKC6_BIOGL
MATGSRSTSPNFSVRFKAREEFNKHRSIYLINLPPSTEGELQEFLGGFKAKKIKINDSLDSALVVLENGNQVDEAIEKLNNKDFKDNTVTVKHGYSNQLICISHIPLTYTDAQFKEMCQKYGTVEYSYIMRAEETGDSKGYGFVEFDVDIEQAKLIKSEFDWKNLDGQILHADFVDEHGQSWDRLQSRCLLITNMADNFVDVSKLREMFGVITSPVYCQIIAKGDRSLGYGIVEFRTAEDAEKTWFKLKDEKIQGKSIVLTFCIPGKSAVVINNRIMWKYGDKLTKSASLLPDPVSAKPVIAGNPLVLSLSKLNPNLMDEFSKVLAELQQAYVSQMMSPVNKPGLLGPAPSLPLSPMMNPNMQLGLLVMLAIHIQAAKREQFTGILAKQLNTLSEQEGLTDLKGPKPSILGDPLTGQANVILTSLKQQLNQVPVLGEDGKELKEPSLIYDRIKFIVKKFIANGRYLNLSLLNNLGQLLVTMKQVDIGRPNTASLKGQSLLGPVPGSLPQPLMGSGKGNSLLGDPPNIVSHTSLNSLGTANVNASLMQAIGLNVGSGSSIGSAGQSLLSQISQGLVHQIGQNLLYQMSVGQTGQSSGRGLLGDVPSEAPKVKTFSAPKSSLLGEPPAHLKAAHTSAPPPISPTEPNAWKGIPNKKKVEQNYESFNNSERWGTGVYESGYNNKGRPVQGYNDYSYGGDTFTDTNAGYGSYETGADYYNNYQAYCYNGQVDYYYQTDNGCYSQFGTGNYGSGAGPSGMTGSGTEYGMGLSTNQASGVNFQDGQTFGKGSSGGLGQDNSKFSTDGYTSAGMGMGGYGYGTRDQLGQGFDAFGTQTNSFADNGMGGTGLLSNTSSQGILGNGPTGSGNSLLGTGRGDGLLGNVGATGNLSGTGSSGNGFYGTGNSYMGSGYMGSGGSVNSYGNNVGSGLGSGMMGSGMGTGMMGSGMGTGMINTGMGDNMGSYNTNMGMSSSVKSSASSTSLFGSGSNMPNRTSAMSGRDVTNASFYTGASTGHSMGLLPSPSKNPLTPIGQKRSYSQLLPKPEKSPEGLDYIGQHSQGLGGHYFDSLKKSKLF